MRILVADDEKDMALALQAILEREHHTVDVPYDGRGHPRREDPCDAAGRTARRVASDIGAASTPLR